MHGDGIWQGLRVATTAETLSGVWRAAAVGARLRRTARVHGIPQGGLVPIVSANPLDRVNKQIKVRSYVVGFFPNDAAIPALVGALLNEQNQEWPSPVPT